MWNDDGGTGSELTYKNIPFFLTSAGYGIFIPSPSFISFEIQSESKSVMINGTRVTYILTPHQEQPGSTLPFRVRVFQCISSTVPHQKTSSKSTPSSPDALHYLRHGPSDFGLVQVLQPTTTRTQSTVSWMAWLREIFQPVFSISTASG